MRPIDADALIATMENMRSISNNVKQRQIEESILHGIVPQIIDDAPTIEAEPVNGWISVKDRLPENDGLYIVCKTIKPHQIVFEAHWKENKWLSVVKNNQLDYVTHWQYLPEPPKGE